MVGRDADATMSEQPSPFHRSAPPFRVPISSTGLTDISEKLYEQLLESFTRVDKGASHDTTNVFVELLAARHVVDVDLVRTVVGCNSCRMCLTYVGGYLRFFAAEFPPGRRIASEWI